MLTLDPALGDMPNADVLIDGDTIAAVGPDLTAGPHANVIDARHRIVMPGFVDTHRHTWQTPVRGVLPSCTLDEYFAGMLNNIGMQYRAEDVYIANLMGALEALNAGITTLLDWSHVNNTPEHADAAIGGLTEAGIRADLRARRSGRRRLVGVQLARASRRHQAHPEAVLSVRRSAADARHGGARARATRHRKSPRTTGSWRAIWAFASACTWACA